MITSSHAVIAISDTIAAKAPVNFIAPASALQLIEKAAYVAPAGVVFKAGLTQSCLVMEPDDALQHLKVDELQSVVYTQTA